MGILTFNKPLEQATEASLPNRKTAKEEDRDIAPLDLYL